MNKNRIQIEYCTQCKWLMRAAWMAQELLTTFEQELEEDKINILTMHKAKGLTAKATIIAGLEDERLPGSAEGSDLEDERRLLYVSLTRAKHYLIMTYCDSNR